ncbi:MAG: tetratricopeptide repeat protein [Syntrophales bacterium]
MGFLIYSNTFRVPFLFDDEFVIVENSGVKDLGNINGSFSGNRSLGFLTFALNYKLHGLHVVGYHVVNLLIHLLNALLVYALVALTLRTPYGALHLQEEGAGFGSAVISRWLALLAALLFVSHPVQTQAVTYIAQRFASLATLFYLASLVMYIKARELGPSGKAGYAFYAVSLFSAVLAMRTKEIAFTLPVVIILYELMFFKGDMKRRFYHLVPFLLTMSLIPLTMMGWQGPAAGTGFSGIEELTRSAGAASVSRWDYLNTQFRVIVTYLRLLFFPVNQNLDYDYPIYRSFFDPAVMLSFLFLLAMFCLGIYLFYKSSHEERFDGFYLRIVSFGIFWFFVTLSVESSIIPIKDVIFEHRLYLPSVGFFMAFLAGMAFVKVRLAERTRVFEQMFIPVLVLAVLGLSLSAYARNRVWQDGITLWEDVVRKSPDKSRVHYGLGTKYAERDRYDDAIREYREAIRLYPDHLAAISEIGSIYNRQGRVDEAIREYQAALKLDPSSAEVHNNLGVAYKKQNRFDDAIREYQAVLRLKPHDAMARNNLGALYQELGKLDDAIREYRAAINSDIHHGRAYHSLGNLYLKMGKTEESRPLLERAVDLDPANVNARNDLAGNYVALGRYEDARRELQALLEIKPDHENARANLEKLQALLNRKN